MERTARSEHTAWLLLVPSALLALSLLLAGCGPLTPVDGPKDGPTVLPQVSIADASVSEGDSGTSDAVFNVTLSEAARETVTVAFATADGTATAGTDYQAASGTLTFTAGETALQITVAVIGDTVHEPDETFTVSLSNPSNASLAVATATGTVTDDDPEPPTVLPRLSVADTTVSEGDSGTSDAVFNVTLSEAAGETVTVAFATADGTATAGTDYQAASGTLTFAAGETAVHIAVAVIGDIVREPDETFVVTLSDPQNATLADAAADGTITDDDDPSAPGQVFRDCADDCPAMVVVPAGSFMMGSPQSEIGSQEDERPVREVTIDAAFAVGVFEVTFAEWQACVTGGGCDARLRDDGGWGRASRPIIDVDWPDAQAYVAWLSQKAGKEYRLLSEAEWEYVARAGTSTPFHTGATISTEQANYDGSTAYSSGQTGQYRGRTLPVGSLARNQLGLYDVHGNVAEWVADCYETGDNGTCSRRVVRGGSWASAPELVRSAYRGWCSPTLRNQVNGFRVARTLNLEP